MGCERGKLDELLLGEETHLHRPEPKLILRLDRWISPDEAPCATRTLTHTVIFDADLSLASINNIVATKTRGTRVKNG